MWAMTSCVYVQASGKGNLLLLAYIGLSPPGHSLVDAREHSEAVH